MNKISTDSADVSLVSSIPDRAVVAISGFNMATTPEYLIMGLYKRFKDTGHPKSIFIETDALPAAPGRALDSVFSEIYQRGDFDFIRGMLIPFLGFSPWLQKATLDNKLAIYGWPIGVTVYWFREIASGRPGLLTKIGIDTFLDPRNDGGALNDRAKEDRECRITLMPIDNHEYLLYRAPKPEFALIRVTSSDKLGNLTMEDEAIRGTVLSIAQATKAMPDRGMVIAQVKRILENGIMNPRQVEVPYPLVDQVVYSPAKYHWQSTSFEYDPRASLKLPGEVLPQSLLKSTETAKTIDQVIAARRVLAALVELCREKSEPLLINLGVGIPSSISSMLEQAKLSDRIITVVESGPWGGLALGGVDFGVSFGSFALSTIPDMFSNYEGGIIDAAALGFLQVEESGGVNSSYLPTKLTGPGGFPVIAEGAPRTFFTGSFTAGHGQYQVQDGKLVIEKDGPINKFVKKVEKKFFSGREAVKNGQEIFYVTERAMFRLKNGHLVLEEVAPGVDIDRDILGRMEFSPEVSDDLKEYDLGKLLDGWTC
ncbi:MAG: acyl CoA:acetate/3-ketoacid CoA transferase [Candidatus Thermoplasmatota archaeon]|jgi:acyl CoA:acetate/3-ketoacid CoA transferase|nr:acyl CoA:acetate/3-ketoacid CoA transferase [Candidatus Thermoplasmatota archaeon]